jgi:hypothetical protein
MVFHPEMPIEALHFLARMNIAFCGMVWTASVAKGWSTLKP